MKENKCPSIIPDEEIPAINELGKRVADLFSSITSETIKEIGSYKHNPDVLAYGELNKKYRNAINYPEVFGVWNRSLNESFKKCVMDIVQKHPSLTQTLIDMVDGTEYKKELN